MKEKRYYNPEEQQLDIANFTENEKSIFVKRYVNGISFVEQTEDLQIDAIKSNPESFKYMINPTEQIQLHAVINHFDNLQYIENPDPELLTQAVRHDAYIIKKINEIHKKHITKQLELEAVKQNGLTVEYLDNPSPDVQIEAIKQEKWSFGLIQNPAPEAIEAFEEEILKDKKRRKGFKI